MQMVPASYLHWVWTNTSAKKNPAVHAYIAKHKKSLKQEHQDAVW